MACRLSLNRQPSSARPTAIGGMTREQIDMELQKGIDSLENDLIYTVDEADAILAQEQYEARVIIEGLEDIKAGRTVDGDTGISNIRDKYGI